MNNEAMQPLIEKADAIYERGDMDDALDAYQIILDQDDTVAWAHNRIGAILAMRGEEPEAEMHFLRALELDNEFPQAHSNLGNLYYNRKEYAKALEKYQQAILLAPSNPVFHQNLHAAYKKLGRYADAVQAMKQAHRVEKELSRNQARETMDKSKQALGRRTGCLRSATLMLLLLSSSVSIFLFM